MLWNTRHSETYFRLAIPAVTNVQKENKAKYLHKAHYMQKFADTTSAPHNAAVT